MTTAQILLLFNLRESAGTSEFTGNDLQPPAGTRVLARRADSRSGGGRFLLHRCLWFDTGWRADKPKFNFGNSGNDHHRAGYRPFACDTNWTSVWLPNLRLLYDSH